MSVFSDRLHIRMSTFTIDVPLGSIRSLQRSEAKLRATTGVHIVRGRAIINGCEKGLVEFEVDPPLRTGRTLSTGFMRQRVDRIVLSLDDPDDFISALQHRTKAK